MSEVTNPPLPAASERAVFERTPRYDRLRRKRASESSGSANEGTSKGKAVTPAQMDFFGSAAASTKPAAPVEPEKIIGEYTRPEPAAPKAPTIDILQEPPETPVTSVETAPGQYSYTFQIDDTKQPKPKEATIVAGSFKDSNQPNLGRHRFFDQYQNADLALFYQSTDWNKDFPELWEQFDNVNPIPASGGISLIKVNGTSHRFIGCRTALNALEAGQSSGEVLLVPEPENKHDEYALKIVDAWTKEQLGYVPRDNNVNKVFIDSMNAGKFVGAYLLRINADMDKHPSTSALVICGWNK